MLVLSRKNREVVVIITAAGERIEVVVSEAKDGRARLGFRADPSVRIFREEIAEPRCANAG